MTKFKNLFLATLAVAALHGSLLAQGQDWKQDRKAALLFGLTQPLVVSGFNVEGNYIHNRFIVDYSHGVSLDFSGGLLPDYLLEQGVVVQMPFSTGFGIGYRFTEWLNLRVEPKWHRFEYYYEGDALTVANRIAADGANYSLGLGVYGFFQPFKKKVDARRGITLAPSIRFWPTLSSAFDGDGFSYQNRNTGQMEQLQSLASGIGFSPLIVNVSIGYTFDLRKP